MVFDKTLSNQNFIHGLPIPCWIYKLSWIFYVEQEVACTYELMCLCAHAIPGAVLDAT